MMQWWDEMPKNEKIAIGIGAIGALGAIFYIYNQANGQADISYNSGGGIIGYESIPSAGVPNTNDYSGITKTLSNIVNQMNNNQAAMQKEINANENLLTQLIKQEKEGQVGIQRKIDYNESLLNELTKKGQENQVGLQRKIDYNQSLLDQLTKKEQENQVGLQRKIDYLEQLIKEQKPVTKEKTKPGVVTKPKIQPPDEYFRNKPGVVTKPKIQPPDEYFRDKTGLIRTNPGGGWNINQSSLNKNTMTTHTETVSDKSTINGMNILTFKKGKALPKNKKSKKGTSSYLVNSGGKDTTNIMTIKDSAFSNAKSKSEMTGGSYQIVEHKGKQYNVDTKTGIAYG